MHSFVPLYVPVGVGTFHMESARACFEASSSLLLSIDPSFVCPEDILLSNDDVAAFLSGKEADLIVFQNVTFANAAYMSEVLHASSCPIVLWTLREPVIDGGRLRLNSLTGAFSAANAMRAFGRNGFPYVFGMPSEADVRRQLNAAVQAARIKYELCGLTAAAVGHTPQGFGFGRALDSELLSVFGVRLLSVEARELIARAKGYSDDSCTEYDRKTDEMTNGLDATPLKNRLGHARLYRAYSEFVAENHIGALASRCWPDFFTDYGTPVCTVLSLLNDDGVAAACEADLYGAISMWIGMRLSGAPVFFGDPVSLDEKENTVTFWHCGAAACSLARKDTGAAVGVHPNRKIGPAMDFGCEAFEDATVFRIGREPDGSFRFFLCEGSALDKPKQFTGTSIVIRTDSPAREIIESGVAAGFEPHFVVIRGRHAETLGALARYYGFPVQRF